MKKVFVIFAILLLAMPFAFAENGNGVATATVTQGNIDVANNSEDDVMAPSPNMPQNPPGTIGINAGGNGYGVKAQTNAELKEMIQLKQQEMEHVQLNLSDEEKAVLQNQNKVRLAVHSLLSMEDLVGGIGQEVSALARNFNNSVQATIRAEEKIEARSGFTRFFAGGDAEAAEAIEEEVAQNQNGIQELKQLYAECQCDPEVKAIMQEQIQNMENEQLRLQVLADNEKASKGLLGWIWK